MKVSIIIPARDEAATIAEVLSRVRVQLEGRAGEVIVVDDASRDDTAVRARNQSGVRVLCLPAPSGKGAAVQAGLAAATGDVVLVQDADLEYDPADYPALLEPFEDPRTEAVFGSRILGKRSGRPSGVSRATYYWGGRLLSWLTTVLYGARITDVSTGYKVVRTSLLREIGLERPGFEFCHELTAKLLRRGVRILEVPIAYAPRTFAEGKKIRWRHGLTAISTLFRYCLWRPHHRAAD